MGVYLPDIMVTLYGCIPTRYYGHSLWVYTYQILWSLFMGVYLPDNYNGHSLWVYTYQTLFMGVYLPDIMVTLYG